MADALFPDNTVLCNFAVVHRLDLLDSYFRGRGRWVEAIAEEVLRSARHLPDPQGVDAWMGKPIEVEDEEDQRRVERIRRDVFGGSSCEPLKHLGEAQTCFLTKVKPEWFGSWWVSDGKEAIRFGKRQGLIVRETIDVVSAVIHDGDLTPQAGFDLLRAMAEADRVVRIPERPTDLR